MSDTLYSPLDPTLDTNGCPSWVSNKALASGRKVLCIIWDGPEYDDHPSKGYKQWSVRPYRVTDICDGTRDDCALYVARELLANRGIDLADLHLRAYPDEVDMPAYIRSLDCSAEVQMPEPTDTAIGQIMFSLYDMNHRSLVIQIEDETGLCMIRPLSTIVTISTQELTNA